MKTTTILLVVVVFAFFVFGFSQQGQAQPAKNVDEYLEKQYAPLGKTTEEILGHENATNRFIIFEALLWRLGRKAEAQLSSTERKLLAVYWFESEINCGGFHQYFFNSESNNAEVALAGLREIGATGAAALLERGMAVFPGGKSPADRSKRIDVMLQIEARSKPVWEACSSEFYKLKESICDLSLTYAKKKKEEIVLP